MRLLRRHLSTILVAMVTAAVTAGGPAIAASIADYAKNADKVDGKHAVGSGASVTSRKGKLVATSGTTGKLPNNIIVKAPDANELDGLNSTAFQRKFKRTIVVSPVGTELQNGTALRKALEAIPTTGASAPTPGSGWLVHIEPGMYNLGTTPLQMLAWVDVEGSGREATHIKCACATSLPTPTGAVLGANRAELRSLSVVNNVPGNVSVVAYSMGASESRTRVVDVLLAATAFDAPDGKIAAGVVTTGDARLEVVGATVRGAAGAGNNSIAFWAIDSSTMSVFDSKGTGSYALGSQDSGEMNAANTMLTGVVSGTARCANSYTESFTARGVGCN